MSTHIGQLVEYLSRCLADSDAKDRVHGEEVPDFLAKELDQPEALPVVCVESAGGPTRDGTLTLELRRFDIRVIATSYDAAHEIAMRIRNCMESLAEGAGTDLCLKSATREAGPAAFRDPENRWRTIHSSWLVFMAGDLTHRTDV